MVIRALVGVAFVATVVGCRVTPYRIDPAIAFEERRGDPAATAAEGVGVRARFTRAGVELSLLNDRDADLTLRSIHLRRETTPPTGRERLEVEPPLPLTLLPGGRATVFVTRAPGAAEPVAGRALGPALRRAVLTWSDVDGDWRFVSNGRSPAPPTTVPTAGEWWPRECVPSEEARVRLLGELRGGSLELELGDDPPRRTITLPYRVERIVLSRDETLERELDLGPRAVRIIRDRVPTPRWVWFRELGEEGEWREAPEKERGPPRRPRYRPGPVVEVTQLSMVLERSEETSGESEDQEE